MHQRFGPVLGNPGCIIFRVTGPPFIPQFPENLDTDWNFINVGYNSVIVGQNQMIWMCKLRENLKK